MAVTLQNVRDLLVPGAHQYMVRISADPFQRCQEVSVDADHAGRRIVVSGYWKDGSQHFAYVTERDIQDNRHIDKFKAALREVAPEHMFEDEITVAYDDSGWL